MTCPTCGRETDLVTLWSNRHSCAGCKRPELNRAQNLRAYASQMRERAKNSADFLASALNQIAEKFEAEATAWERTQSESATIKQPCPNCGENVPDGAHIYTCENCSKKCCTSCTVTNGRNEVICDDCDGLEV